MDTSNIIAILLFILPGILAEKISARMDYPTGERASEFRDIVSGILLSLPIVFIAGGLTVWSCGFTTLEGFTASLNDFSFLLGFTLKVLATAVIIGIFKGLTRNFWTGIMNGIRAVFGKMKIDNRTCWENTFLSKNEYKFLRVFEGNNPLAEGFVKHYSIPGEDRALTLYNDLELLNYPDFDTNTLFVDVIETYVDLEKNVVIKDYDMTKYRAWCKSKSENAPTA